MVQKDIFGNIVKEKKPQIQKKLTIRGQSLVEEIKGLKDRASSLSWEIEDLESDLFDVNKRIAELKQMLQKDEYNMYWVKE